MKRIDELTLLLVDNNISDIELTELAELIEAKEEFDNFAGLLQLEAHLCVSSIPSVADRVLHEIELNRCTRVEEEVMRVVSLEGPSASKQTVLNQALIRSVLDIKVVSKVN